MAKIDELSPEARRIATSRIEAQLWKYYDLELDIDSIREIAEGAYELAGSTEEWRLCHSLVKCKIFESGVVEDLYLWNGWEYEGPTTSREEQEAR